MALVGHGRMPGMDEPAAALEAYLAGFPALPQQVLREVRRALLSAVPGAQERLSYGIPTLAVGGRNIVHYAGWTAHLAVYPVPAGDAGLVAAMAPYRGGKGTLRFAWGEVPYDLIGRVGAALCAERGN